MPCDKKQQSCDNKSNNCNNSKGNCCTRKFTLFYDDFTCGVAPGTTGSPYSFFTVPGIVSGNDAVGGVSVSKENLVIRSTPFTFSHPSGLDHVKYLVYQKPFDVPKCGAEIVYEGVLSVLQTGLNGLSNVTPSLIGVPGGVTGVVNVNSDIRLSSAAFNILDPDTFIVFDFFLGNEDIYAYYERLPFGRTDFGGSGPNYLAFTHVIPVAKRNSNDPANDFVKLAIAYNYRDNYVRWLVNDQEMFRVNRLGIPIERKYRTLEHTTLNAPTYDPALIIRSNRLQFGYGTFNLMEMYQVQNPGQIPNVGLVDLSGNAIGTAPQSDPVAPNINGSPRPAQFISSYPLTGPGVTGTNFGQGAILTIKYLTVYLLAPPTNIDKFPDLYDCDKCLLISRCRQNSFNGVNSNDDLFAYKCQGFIKDSDVCACQFNPCAPCAPYDTNQYYKSPYC